MLRSAVVVILAAAAVLLPTSPAAQPTQPSKEIWQVDVRIEPPVEREPHYAGDVRLVDELVFRVGVKERSSGRKYRLHESTLRVGEARQFHFPEHPLLGSWRGSLSLETPGRALYRVDQEKDGVIVSSVRASVTLAVPPPERPRLQ